MAGVHTGDHPISGRGGIVEELATAGFADAREVGRGAAGVVYRCLQTRLGRTVAVKVLALDLDGDYRERFLREGYAMGRLSGHPNIVNILSVGVTDRHRPYIVMPYHAADSLALRLQQSGRVPWPAALQIGIKLCGALETAHRAGALHRDIKPSNVLMTDYGEPQLSDFGIARVAGRYRTASGVFNGTVAFTAPEVLNGRQPSVAADVYSLGATLYTLIAGTAAREHRSGEEVAAHYLRITTTPVPDMRPQGVPDDVCAAIERAMSLDPANRPATAAEFGRELQAAQGRNGLPPDVMALPNITRADPESDRVGSEGAGRDVDSSAAPSIPSANRPRTTKIPIWNPSTGGIPVSSTSSEVVHRTSSEQAHVSKPHRQPTRSQSGFPTTVIPVQSGSPTSVIPVSDPGRQTVQPSTSGPPQPPPAQPGARKKILLGAAAAVGTLLLVLGGVYFLRGGTGDVDDSGNTPSAAAAQSPAPAQANWRPITNARVAREAVATTEADGTIWIFGGVGSDGKVSGRHEGYDPAIDNWKGGDGLPVPVQRAMSVTWQGNPVVLGGWRAEGPNMTVATDAVWRVVNSRWVAMPPLLQPRAAAAAAVVGGRIIVTGGVNARGELLTSTEIFDGTTWKLGAELPTPRTMLSAASDGEVMYTVGGSDGTTDLATVEAYDPAADTWTALPDLAQPRSDLGVAVADARLVAVGGVSAGEGLKSVGVLDLTTKTWASLPDMSIARHGMAVAAVDESVYVIGGSTGPGDTEVTSTAEALTLAPRKLQPASQWISLPDAPIPRLMTAWTVLDDKIWIAGGMSHGTTLPLVQSYDPQTGAWQSQPPLPVPLHHATAATYRGEMVVIGGASDNLIEASNKVFALRGGSWVELPSLGHARAAAAAAVVGDKLVVVGGQNAKQLVPQTEVFDGSTWQDAADLPTPREHLAAVSDGVYVYAVGGRFLAADKNSAAFERFDPQSGEWVRLVDMPTPRGSYGAAYIDGRIVAVGGEEPTQVLDAAEMYDIADGKWIALTPMPTPRHGEVVAAVGDIVYAIGGANRPTHEGPVATIEALDFA